MIHHCSNPRCRKQKKERKKEIGSLLNLLPGLVVYVLLQITRAGLPGGTAVPARAGTGGDTGKGKGNHWHKGEYKGEYKGSHNGNYKGHCKGTYKQP